ncbi:MAG: 50S ribosomal protein L34 [Candidatus Brocadiia bacterium]
MKIKRRNSNLHKVRRSGFRARMKTRSGRKILKRRRAKGCKRLAPSRRR